MSLQQTLPGYSIPHELNNLEAQAFFERQLTNPLLQNYMERREPVQGVIIQDGYGEILVWFDASGRLRIIDVTNMRIAEEVPKAVYQSDPEYIKMYQDALRDLMSKLPSVSEVGVGLVLVIVALVLALKVIR